MRITRIVARLFPLLLGATVVGCEGTPSEAEMDEQAATAQAGPIVIGAGIAGARAAYELKKAGVTGVTLIAPAAAPGSSVPDTGLTRTLALANGAGVDVGASLFPETYEILDVVHELGLDAELVPMETTLAIVKNGKPVVIDQANALTLYKLFSVFELTPAKAMATQLEISRLKRHGFNHRDGRLYAGESRTIEAYLTQYMGRVPAEYLSIVPVILGGQDPKTASAGFSQTLFMMTAPKVYTMKRMETLPLEMIEASGAKVELASVLRVAQGANGTTVVDGVRSTGQPARWTTKAPVIVAAPGLVSAKILQSPTAEERALLANPMRSVAGLTIELTPGWKRPAALKDTTYGGVPDVERGDGNVRGWALDYRSPDGSERTVGLTLEHPVTQPAEIAAVIREASKYLPGLETHVKSTIPAVNPFHAPTLSPSFYEAVGAYWPWIAEEGARKIILAGAATNQYGMDGASFSAKLAAAIAVKKLGAR